MCVSIGTSLGATLVGIPGILCYCVSTGTSLGTTPGGLPGDIFLFEPLELVPGVAASFWYIYELLLRALVVVPYSPHTSVHYACWFIFPHLL